MVADRLISMCPYWGRELGENPGGSIVKNYLLILPGIKPWPFCSLANALLLSPGLQHSIKNICSTLFTKLTYLANFHLYPLLHFLPFPHSERAVHFLCFLACRSPMRKTKCPLCVQIPFCVLRKTKVEKITLNYCSIEEPELIFHSFQWSNWVFQLYQW